MPSPVVLLALAALLLACGGREGGAGPEGGATGDAGGPLAGDAAPAGDGSDAAPPRWSEQGIFFTADFVLLAHRGGGKLRPEHTLEAYANALKWDKAAGGPDPVVIELDLRPTKDGAVVTMHDETVDRTTDGEGPVVGMTLAELKQLDAGHRFSADGGKTFPWRGKGLTVPTLQEVLAKFPDAVYSVEIKRDDPPIVGKVLAAFAEIGAMDRTLFSSFNDLVIEDIRERRPDALTAFGLIEMVKFTQLGDEDMGTYEPPAPFVIPPWDLLTPELMARMKKVELRVHAWTVNDAATMNELLDMGVDGIFTDDPELLAQVRLGRAGGK